MNNYLAVFGRVRPPPGVITWGPAAIGPFSGLQQFLGAIIKTIIVLAGIYALINLILAGLSFMSAGGNPEKIAQAWAKIWQTMLGLFIAAASFVLAGIFGWLIFRNFNALLQLQIFTPP